MKKNFRHALIVAAIWVGCTPLASCSGGDDPVAPVTINVTGPNAVSAWNETGTATINAAATPGTGSAAEQRPSIALDLATMHLAIYDALMAIVATHKPYAVTPSSDASGASQEAAVHAAAYGVLQGLYPNRGALYQAAYNTAVAALPAGDAKAKGLALGAEVAQRLLALRGDDGRSVVLPAYLPGTAPGQFRGTSPINRQGPFIKPLALTSAAQFHAAPPPALDSAAYAADFNETRTLGSATSTTRTDAQLDAARFHTEPPPRFWPRNLRNFAMTDRSLAEHARLMAMVFTAEADSEIACFESKYFYQAWRPFSAITLADTDGNAATDVDAAWAPVVTTPNHPEYPAAHSCVSGAVSEALKAYYRTGDISFKFDSTITSTTHSYATTQALIDDAQIGRIAGGMHFRFSTVAGATLGANVGKWVAANYFQPR